MNARSPEAFMFSFLLHLLFAAAMFFAAFALKDEVTKESKTFELVQGGGDNYAATVAPAIGTPEGNPDVKMPDLPPLPAPPAPTPPAPEPVVAPAPTEPSPVQAVAPPKETPPPPKPAPKPTPKPEPSPVTKADPKKPDPAVPDLKRSMIRTQNKLAGQQKRQREKEAKAAAAAEAAFRAKQAELARKKAALAAAQGQSGIKTIDAKGIAEGVRGGSTANDKGGAGGTALSREEQDLLGTYIELIKLRIAEAHEKPTGLSENLVATVEIYVAADGSIPKSKIAKSSGNAEFDASALAAVRNVRSIGPRPDGKGSSFSFKMKMKDED